MGTATMEPEKLTYPATITAQEMEEFFQALENGHSGDQAAKLVGHSRTGIWTHLKAHPELMTRAQRARIVWVGCHLKTLKDPGNNKGASAKVKGALGALASVDERFRPKQRIDHHVEGEVTHRPVFAPVDITGSKALTGQDRKALPAPGGLASDVDELLDGDADSMTLDMELGASESVESEPTPDCESSEPLTVEENEVDRE